MDRFWSAKSWNTTYTLASYLSCCAGEQIRHVVAVEGSSNLKVCLSVQNDLSKKSLSTCHKSRRWMITVSLTGFLYTSATTNIRRSIWTFGTKHMCYVRRVESFKPSLVYLKSLQDDQRIRVCPPDIAVAILTLVLHIFWKRWRSPKIRGRKTKETYKLENN
jgi:hypothetical protein